MGRKLRTINHNNTGSVYYSLCAQNKATKGPHINILVSHSCKDLVSFLEYLETRDIDFDFVRYHYFVVRDCGHLTFF